MHKQPGWGEQRGFGTMFQQSEHLDAGARLYSCYDIDSHPSSSWNREDSSVQLKCFIKRQLDEKKILGHWSLRQNTFTSRGSNFLCHTFFSFCHVFFGFFQWFHQNLLITPLWRKTMKLGSFLKVKIHLTATGSILHVHLFQCYRTPKVPQIRTNFASSCANPGLAWETIPQSTRGAGQKRMEESSFSLSYICYGQWEDKHWECVITWMKAIKGD